MNEATLETINCMRAVTIAREYGSGGGEIAVRLARRLGWYLIDHALIERVASELGTSVAEAEAYDEQSQGVIAQLLKKMQYVDPAYLISIPREAFLSDEAVYQQTVEQIVKGAAAQGQVVIVGRASQVILIDQRDVLRVRVIAPFSQRVAYVMQRENVDHQTAEARIHRKEQERARYLERTYHHRPDEAQLYDLVVNTSRLDLESAVDLIGCTLYGIAKGLASNLDELGPATGLSRYPAPPEDLPSLAR